MLHKISFVFIAILSVHTRALAAGNCSFENVKTHEPMTKEDAEASAATDLQKYVDLALVYINQQNSMMFTVYANYVKGRINVVEPCDPAFTQKMRDYVNSHISNFPWSDDQTVGKTAGQDTREKEQVAISGCAPSEYGAQILSDPDPGKIDPEWQLGMAWSLSDAKVVENSTGRYVYGKLISPRGGFVQWAYGKAEQWNCQ